jgi:hypothetical protein
MSPLLSVSKSLIDPMLSLLSLYTFSPTSFEVRQLPFIVDISVVADVVIDVEGAALVVVSVAGGVCANATLASSAEAATPATAVFIDILVLLSSIS